MSVPRDGDFTPGQVRRLRDLLGGLPQREAAARFGVSLNTWSRWELGTLRVHRARIGQLQQVLEDLEKEQRRLEEQRRADQLDLKKRQKRAESIDIALAQEEKEINDRLLQWFLLNPFSATKIGKIHFIRGNYRFELDGAQSIFYSLIYDQLNESDRTRLLDRLRDYIVRQVAMLTVLDDLNGQPSSSNKAQHKRQLDNYRGIFSVDDSIWEAIRRAQILLEYATQSKQRGLPQIPEQVDDGNSA